MEILFYKVDINIKCSHFCSHFFGVESILILSNFNRCNVSLDENYIYELVSVCFFAANVAGTKYF